MTRKITRAILYLLLGLFVAYSVGYGNYLRFKHPQLTSTQVLFILLGLGEDDWR